MILKKKLKKENSSFHYCSILGLNFGGFCLFVLRIYYNFSIQYMAFKKLYNQTLEQLLQYHLLPISKPSELLKVSKIFHAFPCIYIFVCCFICPKLSFSTGTSGIFLCGQGIKGVIRFESLQLTR